MKKDGVHLNIQRIEIVSKTYDTLGRVVREEWEYYFPEDKKPVEIGFTNKQKV